MKQSHMSVPSSKSPHRRLGHASSAPSPEPQLGKSRPLFWKRLAFAAKPSALVFLALFVTAGYLAYYCAFHHPGKYPLGDSTTWELGQEKAGRLTGEEKADIGGWTRLFDLPRSGMVLNYLQGQGLAVSRLIPLHEENTREAATITYQVYAQVISPLLRVHTATWKPSNPDLQPFATLLVLNEGLPAGQCWDPRGATIKEEAGAQLNLEWKVRWDKQTNIVATDQLPFDYGIFTPQQIDHFQAKTVHAISQLQNRIQAINQEMQAHVKAQIARLSKPARPTFIPSDGGGNNSSSQPTPSTALTGAAAINPSVGASTNAKVGAGTNANTGPSSGSAQNTAAKINDKLHEQNLIALENMKRFFRWRSQTRILESKAYHIIGEGQQEKQRAIQDLAKRLASAHGRIDAVVAPADMPQQSPAAADIPSLPKTPPPQPASSQPINS
jgi:hypothetical protein